MLTATGLLLCALAWPAQDAQPAPAAAAAPATGDLPAPTQPPRPAVPLSPPRLAAADALACAACHAEVVAEWADSAHAIAWVDSEYQDALENRRRPELCHGCHIPQPLLASGTLPERPTAREEQREHGVSCDSCHLGPAGSQLGPRGAASTAHASTASPLLQGGGSSALCATCHSTNIGPVLGVAKDFVESGQAQAGRSCVGCHFARVERPAASAGWPEGMPAGTARLGPSHALQTPRDPIFLASAFECRLDGPHLLLLKNRAGHRVPGLIGRRLVFELQVLGPDDGVLESQTFEFDTSRYLPVGGERRLEWKAAGRALHLVGRHVDPRAAEPVVFLDARLPLAP